jgi:GNAT superfamily N-acetyltransferase
MRIEVTEETPENISEYARIPMSLVVREILEASALDGGRCGLALSAQEVPTPFLKDYDAVESPLEWSKAFDLSNWGFFGAHFGGHRVGGATVAFDTPGVTMLEDRQDIAVLWDIRVGPDARGKGVGTALFKAAEAWSVTKGCRQLKVETQNINVPACRFYAKQGCVLGAIHRFAYPEFPNEVQLLWYKALDNG